MGAAIQRIGIAGAGVMGGGIGQMFAEQGREVWLWDLYPAALDRGLAVIRSRLRGSAEKGRIPVEEVGRVLGRIHAAPALGELAGCGLVIEAVTEDEAAKRALLTQLSAILPEDSLVGTNTSSLSIEELAQAMRRPERFLGIHFFNPPTKLELVEVVPAQLTASETLVTVKELLAACGKTPIVVKDSPGFIVNRLLLLLINEAARLLDEGLATAEDIDTAMRLGALHPAGPLAVADLIGLDTCQKILEVLESRLGDRAFEPARCLRDRVAQGKLGRKTGEGFHGAGGPGRRQ